MPRRTPSLSAFRNKPNSRWQAVLTGTVYVACIAGPLLTLPQLVEIFITRSAASVSLLTWFSYLVLNVPWLLYGISHREKPLVLVSVAYLVIDALIVAGILLYR